MSFFDFLNSFVDQALLTTLECPDCGSKVEGHYVGRHLVTKCVGCGRKVLVTASGKTAVYPGVVRKQDRDT